MKLNEQLYYLVVKSFEDIVWWQNITIYLSWSSRAQAK